MNLSQKILLCGMIVVATLFSVSFPNKANAVIPGVDVSILPDPGLALLVDAISCDVNFIWGCDSSGNALPDPSIGQCGSANYSYSYDKPTTNLCSKGEPSYVWRDGSYAWNWNCTLNGKVSSTCVGYRKVDAICGDIAYKTYSSTPTRECYYDEEEEDDVCTRFCGNSNTLNPSITGTGPWSWTCISNRGGAPANCTAQVTGGSPVSIPGSCGTSNNQTLASAPTTNLCSDSSSLPSVNGTGPWNWICPGLNGGADSPQCNAYKACIPTCANPSTICSGQPLGDDGCGNVCAGTGTKTDGICCVSNGCEANTCAGSTCNNGCRLTAPGTKSCEVDTGAWREVTP